MKNYVTFISIVSLLEESAPVEVASETRGLSITVEKMEINKSSAVFDFQINQGEEKGRRSAFFGDVARNDVTLVKEAEKDIYDKPISHSIKVLNKEDMRFRSTFDISEASDFSLDNYVLRVDLGGMGINIPVELEKIRIDMNGTEAEHQSNIPETTPDYDLMVEYDGGLPTHAIHLWLGEENKKSTLMYMVGEGETYLTSSKFTNQLRELIISK